MNEQKEKRDTIPKADSEKREALRKNSEITLHPLDAWEDTREEQTFTVLEHLGAGATSFAYRAVELFSGTQIVLKECYPRDANLVRGKQQELQLVGDDTAFRQAKNRFQDAYNRSLELFYQEREAYNLDFALSAPLGFYEGNGTIYAAYLVRTGVSYDKRTEDASLLELTQIILNLSKAICAIHSNDYLYLDVREDNIFLLGCNETSGDVQGILLIDFDSLIKTNELEIHRNRLRFSGEDRPPELREPINTNEIHFKTDQYQIAALFYKRLCGRHYDMRTGIALDDSRLLAACGNDSYLTVAIREFLENTLLKRCYQDDGAFINDLQKICDAAYLKENPVTKHLKTSILQEYAYKSCKHDQKDKFQALRSLLNGQYYENHIRLRSAAEVEEQSDLRPFDVLTNNRLLLIAGDGGIGKSTLLQSYRESLINRAFSVNEIIPLYIELHKYQGREYFQNDSHSYSWIPFYVLTHISGSSATAATEELRKQYDDLNTLFSQKKNGFQFVLLLDGFNELSEANRFALISEISYFSKQWQNVQFVLTGRIIPEDLKDFEAYTLTGLNDNEIRSALQKKYSEEAIQNVFQNHKLLEILHVPLFLNLYLGTDPQLTQSVHQTRGELLDAFVSSGTFAYTESALTERTAESTEEQLKQHFAIDFLLPFAASKFDKARTFTLSEEEMLAAMEQSCQAVLDSDSPADLESASDFQYQDSIEALRSALPDDDAEKRRRVLRKVLPYFTKKAAYLTGSKKNGFTFVHQYFRDYFAAKLIQNALLLSRTMENHDPDGEKRLQFLHQTCGINYPWSDEVCIILGEVIGDYKNDPEYKPE